MDTNSIAQMIGFHSSVRLFIMSVDWLGGGGGEGVNPENLQNQH